jgi:acyl carrier protein
MVPSAFVRLDTLPLTPSGKLDRRALPTPQVQFQNEFAEPSSGLERDLTVIWKSVLGVDRIGAKDDFFELGGHSLLALRMMAEIKKTLGVNLPLATLLEAPTIERLAEFLQSQGIVAPSQPPPNAGVGTSSRPSLAERIAWAARTSVRWSFSRSRDSKPR